MFEKTKKFWNCLKALHNYRTKKIVLDNKPVIYWIEPTNQCNLNCIMCPTGSLKTGIKRGLMRLSMFKEIIDEIKDYTSAITLALSGESLIHPRFFDMVKYACENGVRTKLNTNITLINKRNAKLILESGLDYMNFSFDGYNKKTYEKIRVGANFEEVIDNMIYFLRLRKEMGLKKPYTVIAILTLGVGNYTEQEKKDFINKFDGLIDGIREREAFSWGNKFKDSDTFKYFKAGDIFNPCSRLWCSLGIAWNGNVIPCSWDSLQEYTFGNVKENSVYDIWNSEKMIKLRQAMVNGTYLDVTPICENCPIIHQETIWGMPPGIRLALSETISSVTGITEGQLLNLGHKVSTGVLNQKPVD